MKEIAETATPVFDATYRQLKESITGGSLTHGERLPTEKWLCEQYDVSRTTLRKVIEQLEADGYLERRARKGVYISYLVTPPIFEFPTSVHNLLRGAGRVSNSEIISYHTDSVGNTNPPIFRCPAEEPVSVIRRVRYVDGRPFAIQTLCLRTAFFPEFDPWWLRDQSFYTLLSERYHLEIDRTNQKVSTCSASKEAAGYLQIPVRTPLLHTTSLVITPKEEEVVHMEHIINTNVFPYTFCTNSL